jgi:hypothetical protein
MNLLLRQELERLKEKNRCLSRNSNNGGGHARLHHPGASVINLIRTERKKIRSSAMFLLN